MMRVNPVWALLAGICVVTIGLASCGGGGGSADDLSAGVASLGIDPLGRGDGIDLTESDYTGRCYEDDTLEANRPLPPDPRVVAAEEAEAVAQASEAAADAARAALEVARTEFEESFEVPVNPNPPDEDLDAGLAYVAAAAVAVVATDAALTTAQIIFFLTEGEEETTWGDIFEDFELSKLLLVQFKPEIDFGGSAIVDFFTEVISDVLKEEMLEFLEDAREQAIAAYNLAVEQFCAACRLSPGELPGSVPRMAVADPVKQQAFADAQTIFDAAEAQSVTDSEAAYEARLYAETAPSEYPPCDARELGQALYDAFCTDDFVNPITQEDEAQAPGLTERFNNYIDRVCTAVSPT